MNFAEAYAPLDKRRFSASGLSLNPMIASAGDDELVGRHR
jgi:hypothetical protein